MARDAAKRRRFRLRHLRPTFAIHAAMGKESLPMTGRFLGHANVKSTARYAHLDAAGLTGNAIESALGLHTVLGVLNSSF